MENIANATAWWAAFLCLATSAQIATTYCRRNPWLFTVMALLACNWALLLPAYAADNVVDRSPLIAVVGGFLLVYIGGLLLLESHSELHRADQHGILGWQIVSMYLLLTIAFPTVPAIFGRPLPQISLHQFELVIIIVMDCLGLGSIIFGSRKLFPLAGLIALITVSVSYAVAEIILVAQIWSGNEHGPMPDYWKYIFAVCKIAYTLILGFGIAYHEMSEIDRARGPLHWIALLLRLTNLTPKAQLGAPTVKVP